MVGFTLFQDPSGFVHQHLASFVGNDTKSCVACSSQSSAPLIGLTVAISDSLYKVSTKAIDVLTAMAILVELTDCDSLVKSASTSLNNKVVSQYSTLLASMAVDAVLSATIGIYGEEEYLEMTKKYCDNNLTGRIKDFLSQVALMSLSGAIVVLKFCEDLLPMVEDLKIVQKYVDVACSK
ncbi:hypothetical protein COP2_028103 [Malus domestica]